jgi:hypothetical protein
MSSEDGVNNELLSENRFSPSAPPKMVRKSRKWSSYVQSEAETEE